MDAEETRKVSVQTIENLRAELQFKLCFLLLFFVAGVGKGIITNWDGHYWGYMAKNLPRDITMLGIYG